MYPSALSLKHFHAGELSYLPFHFFLYLRLRRSNVLIDITNKYVCINEIIRKGRIKQIQCKDGHSLIFPWRSDFKQTIKGFGQDRVSLAGLAHCWKYLVNTLIWLITDQRKAGASPNLKSQHKGVLVAAILTAWGHITPPWLQTTNFTK